MSRKKVLSIHGFRVLAFVLFLAGTFPVGTTGQEGVSKLTIAYIADEIGRIEPCG